VHAWAIPLIGRAPRPRLAAVAAAVVVLGAITLTAAMAYTGGHGMPRRYVAYDPQLAIGHRLAAIAGAAFAVGLAGVVVAWLTAPRSPPARPSS
jgi:heme/copper-type cytochrome/quinol oxidase subunit 1